MSEDFFENTRQIMIEVLHHQINDEQVKAFLHYTEVGYKKTAIYYRCLSIAKNMKDIQTL